MKKYLQWFLVGFAAASAAGCAGLRQESSGLLHKRDMAYLNSQAEPALRIPAGLSGSKIGDDYTIPQVISSGVTPASTEPPYGLQTGQLSTSLVSIQNDPAGYPGVVVRQAVDKTFSTLQTSLQNSTYTILRASSRLNYLVIRDTRQQRDYQLHLLKVGQDTRIYIADGDNQKLSPVEAEQMTKSLYNILTQSKAYKPASTSFLKPLFGS